jgi:predicted ArsR family transcriptional regulator
MWTRRLTENTRGRLVSLLRRRSLTVEEMARELGVTDNAVRAQLASLERDGLVRQDGFQRGSGKPSAQYGLTAEFEGTLSQAYIPLVVRLLRELAHTIPEHQLKEILERLGRDWADELPRRTGGTRGEAEAASALLNELGGVTEVEQAEGRTYVRGFSCPLATAVRENPLVCRVIESLLTQLLGVEVREQCDRGHERSRCCFEIAAQP